MLEPHQRLDEALKARCAEPELDLTWVDLAKRADVSVKTLDAIRRGRNRPNARTTRRLEDALRWERGSIAAIYAGGDPTPVTQERPALVDPDVEAEAVWSSLTDEERERAMAKATALLQLARGQDPGDAEVVEDLIRWRREHRG